MLGGLFLAGLLTDMMARHTPVPRVTLMLIVGFLAGPSVLDLLPAFSEQWFPILTDIALVMIGFLLGQKITPSALRQSGKAVLAMSLGEVLVTSSLVFSVLLLLGMQHEIALLLGAIAPASAPAATVDVVRESRAKGTFTQDLLSIVAIDDAWGLLMYKYRTLRDPRGDRRGPSIRSIAARYPGGGRRNRTSVVSYVECRIKPLWLDPGVAIAELPVDARPSVVTSALPGLDFGPDLLQHIDPSV